MIDFAKKMDFDPLEAVNWYNVTQNNVIEKV